MRKQKFCILTSQRSGSTWLRELLDSHPLIVSFPELLISQKPHHNWTDDHIMLFYRYKNNCKFVRPFSLFNYIGQLETYPGNHSAIGFKLMYDQIFLYPEVLIKICSEQFKVIHLVRRNYLDVMVSVANMKDKRIVQSRSKIEVSKIKLNPNTLLFDLHKQDILVSSFEHIFKLMPNKVLNITYESLCTSLDETLSSITTFLNLKTDLSEFYTDLQKINSGSLQSKIMNYEEICNTLKGSKFEYLLDSTII